MSGDIEIRIHLYRVPTDTFQGPGKCYICGRPVDQAAVEKLLLEDEGVVARVQPYRLCVDCTKAFRDGRLQNREVAHYTTGPSPP